MPLLSSPFSAHANTFSPAAGLPRPAGECFCARPFRRDEEDAMNLPQLLDSLKNDRAFMENVTRWEVLPPRPARYGGFPEKLDRRLVAALRRRGIEALHGHPSDAEEAAVIGPCIGARTPRHR